MKRDGLLQYCRSVAEPHYARIRRRSLEPLTDRQRCLDYTERPLCGCYHPRRSSRAPARGNVRDHRGDQALQGSAGVSSMTANAIYEPRNVRPAKAIGHSRARVTKLLRVLGKGALVGHPCASISLSCRRQQTEVALR
jgi:hypothetical protein